MTLHRQYGTRRWILGALVAMVAVATSLGTGSGASASQKAPDNGSREAFRLRCEVFDGGTFTDTGDGNLWCQYPDGGQTVCDSWGDDCWYSPPPRQAEPDDPFDPYNGGGGEVSDDPGEAETPAPVAESPSPAGTQPSVEAPDDDQGQDTGKRKGKGKKGKKGGKRRK